MPREFPDTPLLAVGAVVIHQGRVLLVRRGNEPRKGHWSLPGGMLELGETLVAGLVREVSEETGLVVEPLQLIELLDRIHRDGERVRYHYVIADYLCRVVAGDLQAASDADDVLWAGQADWHASTDGENRLKLDEVTMRVIAAGWYAMQRMEPAAKESKA